MLSQTLVTPLWMTTIKNVIKINQDSMNMYYLKIRNLENLVILIVFIKFIFFISERQHNNLFLVITPSSDVFNWVCLSWPLFPRKFTIQTLEKFLDSQALLSASLLRAVHWLWLCFDEDFTCLTWVVITIIAP